MRSLTPTSLFIYKKQYSYSVCPGAKLNHEHLLLIATLACFRRKLTFLRTYPSIWGLSDNWSSGHRLENMAPIYPSIKWSVSNGQYKIPVSKYQSLLQHLKKRPLIFMDTWSLLPNNYNNKIIILF